MNPQKKILLNSPNLIKENLELDIEIYRKTELDIFPKIKEKDFSKFTRKTLSQNKQFFNRLQYTFFRRAIYKPIKNSKFLYET